MSDYGSGGPYPDRPSDPWRQDDDPYPTHPSSPYGPAEHYGPPDQYGPEQQYGPGQQAPAQRSGGSHAYRDPDPYAYQGSPETYRQQDPYPDQPDPYPHYQDRDRYQEPADPYERRAEPSPRPPEPPPTKKTSTGLIVALVAVLVLVLCGGGGLALYLMQSKGGTPTGAQKVSADPGGSAGHASANGSPGAPSGSAAPSYDPTSIIQGRCVVNDGSENAPKLRPVACGANSYLVLARFDGTDDTHKCDTVTGATHNYYYQTTPSTLDFVLCLKKQ